MANFLEMTVDLGTSGAQAYAGSSRDRMFYIPNAVRDLTEFNDGTLLQDDQDPLKDLRVEIRTDLVREGRRRVVVGESAAKQEHNDEAIRGTKKSENEQTYIMLLTTLAYDAATRLRPNKESVIEVEYLVSTALPMTEVIRDQGRYKEDFRNKLKRGCHIVEFLDTPQLRGIKVVIRFYEILVNAEGFLAYFRLREHMRSILSPEKYNEWCSKNILIYDLGLGTWDAALFENGKVVPAQCAGAPGGVVNAMDDMIDYVLEKTGREVRSREEMAEIYFQEDAKFFYNGKNHDLKAQLDQILDEHGKDHWLTIKRRADKAGKVDEIWPVGGGSILMQEAILKHNKGYPIIFRDDINIRNLIVDGLFLVKEIYKEKKGNIKERIETPQVV
ncbi:hypothetical protein GCM10011571_35260 [Marinithermofilum abyssi]|uniref:Actin homologue MreB-like C-terminal domain-containing protein n=1 Tax=Marinithermofilum abyssi TaxID=1571185 RepID=A0A8J2VG45_9BACL|nr:ParM/StbA family protein [Marinithermofilum abyssi]GGE30009.1 hypothetical protein GCM10011571_35260 [Marinithermofilum abyssi]